jgi:protein-S-isoprenylcysteine O-methyltransferase Ste14
MLSPGPIELIPWYAFATYWAITALRVKRTKRTESSRDRLSTIVVLSAAFTCLFYGRLHLGPLDLRFVPADNRITWAGIVLTSLGVALAIWARYCLGQYWSARVTLKQGHRLIRSGPYRSIRHPIYTGIWLATSGTALVLGEWRGVLAVALVWVAHSRKAAREETLLLTEFGDEYASYRRSTGFLFPRFSRPTGIGH